MRRRASGSRKAEFDQDHKPVSHPFDSTAYPDIGEVIPGPAGSCIEPLAMVAASTDDLAALDLAIRFANGELGQHRSDKFPPDQKRFAGFAPDGSFAGHFHSKTTTLIGIAKLGRYLVEHGRLEEGHRYLRAARRRRRSAPPAVASSGATTVWPAWSPPRGTSPCIPGEMG